MTNLAAIAAARVIQFYQGTNVAALISAVAGSMQPLADAIEDVAAHGDLTTAYGRGLDNLGDDVLMGRNDAADNTFRVRLTGRAMAMASDNTPESLRAIAECMLAGVSPVWLRPQPPGCTILEALNLPQQDGDAIAAILSQAAPVGTRVILRWQPPAYEGPQLGWAEFGEDPAAPGWAEFGEDPSAAGAWSESWDGI